jgi:Fe-S-cluster-containing hydrogenase component 2
MKKIVIDESKCNGCGTCAAKCREGAIRIVNGKAQVVASLCDSAGACIGSCPRGAISFREHAGCPSAAMSPQAGGKQWPVQLSLVQSAAPFLKDADLLITADCVPCAYEGFHRELLKGKALLVGCPKFDDLGLYKERLSEILRVNRLKSVTYARMEVPCCQGLKRVIEEAIAESGKKVPFHEVVISVKGERL